MPGASQRVACTFDVAVVGGGAAGIAAAYAAAREGATTLLVEARNFIGGAATFGLPILSFHDLRGRRAIGGFAEQFVRCLEELDATTGHLPAHRGAYISTYTLVDAEAVKYLAESILARSGVTLLYSTLVGSVESSNGRLQALELWNKDGAFKVAARVVVDTSGDADVAARAGVPFHKGRDESGKTQPMTLMFKMVNVDLERFTREAPLRDVVFCPKPGSRKVGFVRATVPFAPWIDALREEVFPDAEPERVFWCNSLYDGEVNINASRVVGFDGTSAAELTRAEIEGRRQAHALARFFVRHVPGFERARLITTAPSIGVRETRRIVGEYVLTADDVIRAREFEDRIARSPYPIDIHDPSGKGWRIIPIAGGSSASIPYRCLVPLNARNLLVAGRCISVDPEAFGSIRVMAVCMATGEATGIAAAMASRADGEVRHIDVPALQSRLREVGAALDSE